jgi:hypothetical protein
VSTAQAIRIEGGIVPASLLQLLRDGTLGTEESRSPESFHVVGRQTIPDAVNRAWSYLVGAWEAWNDAQAKAGGMESTSASLARERWLLPLLQELGYGRLAPGHGVTVDDQSYPVSHEWNHVPIHLVGPGVDLDRRNPGVQGAARAPQAMVQELLNRDEARLWALLSNGLRLRLLRDSTALAGSAYVEFDLQAIFDGELFSEFMILWQLCHESRLEARPGPEGEPIPAQGWLELWREDSIKTGTRALDQLRGGVERALEHLGSGFLSHQPNGALRDALSNGELTAESYHRHLLRLVYRLLFLFVAEDREVLLDPAAPSEAKERYDRYFSTRRLRQQAHSRQGSSAYADLWQAQVIILKALGGDGQPELGIPALGGLFDPEDGTSDPLLGLGLGNDALLAAIRDLGWFQSGQRLQAVDYRNLGAEELGGVYESLLELIPRVLVEDRRYQLAAVSGNERKTTGSYYTPSSLVSALLDTALDPVIERAAKAARKNPDKAERRLLALTICDPACGSGHFLVAAARRLARRLAAIRSGEDEPTPDAVRHALRDVVGRSVYGVDLNPLAAELAKVSLWLEAIEPGKPLGFLDSRIRVGNSLLGATPALLDGGLPDGAFGALEGDDKKVASAAKKRNTNERKSGVYGGQDELDLSAPTPNGGRLVKAHRELLGTPDSVEAVRAQASKWRQLERSKEHRGKKLHADAWIAAFVWPKTSGEGSVPMPTSATIRRISETPFADTLAACRRQIAAITDQYRFFHWHIEFPEVFDKPGDDGPEGWSGGFDCMIGNPPWERVKLQEQEFFAARDEEIANAPNKAARGRLIAKLEHSESLADQQLHADFIAARRQAEGESALLHNSGRYPLAGRGDVNTYAVFCELASTLVAPTGQVGIIVPTGIATDATTQYYFKDLVQRRRIRALYDFENAAPIFQGVHRSFKFCLLTVTGRQAEFAQPKFAFFLHDPRNIEAAAFTMTPEEITLVNPNTGTLPIFRTRRDAEITLGIYHRVPVLLKEGDPDGNPWGIRFMTMFHMSNDSHLFYTREELEADGWTLNGNVFEHPITDGRTDPSQQATEWERMMPLYEAKMIHHYDTRWATYQPDGSTRYMTEQEKAQRLGPLPRYWVHESEIDKKTEGKSDSPWLLGWRRIARATDERTLIGALLPQVGAGDSIFLALLGPAAEAHRHMLAAAWSSLPLDYVTRQKMGGTNLNFFIMEQLAIPHPDMDLPELTLPKPFSSWVATAVDRLNAWTAPVEERALIRAELDALMFHVYGVARDDVSYIMETFPIVQRKDEDRYGEYRTKRLIMEAYDAMAEAISIGQPYYSPFEAVPA